MYSKKMFDVCSGDDTLCWNRFNAVLYLVLLQWERYATVWALLLTGVQDPYFLISISIFFNVIGLISGIPMTVSSGKSVPETFQIQVINISTIGAYADIQEFTLPLAESGFGEFVNRTFKNSCKVRWS